MGLELAGLAIVAWGFHKDRVLFAKSTFVAGAMEWLKRFPPFKQSATAPGAMGVSHGMSVGRARVRVSAGPQASLQGRVKLLEDNYDRLFDEVGTLETKLSERVAGLSSKLAAEKAAREVADEQHSEKLDAAVVGGLHLAMAGAWILAVGIFLSTASSEIAPYLPAY